MSDYARAFLQPVRGADDEAFRPGETRDDLDRQHVVDRTGGY